MGGEIFPTFNLTLYSDSKVPERMKRSYPFVFTMVLCWWSLAGMAQQWVDKTYSYDSIMDITYGAAIDFNGVEQSLRMDIYNPICDDPGGISGKPLVVFIHGGGFLAGDKQEGTIVRLSREFARRGYVTASINYRLGMISDEGDWSCNFPEYACLFATDEAEWIRALYRGIQDAKGAIRYLVNRQEEYRIDPENIFVAGESAGGFIALGAALLDVEEEKFAAAFALDDAPIPHPNALSCAHNQGQVFEGDFIARPDLGSIEGDLEPSALPYTIKGIGNIFGALATDLLEQHPQGKPKPVLYQFHQPCDLVVPIDTGPIGEGLNWCFTNGYGCYAVANTPEVLGSRAISDLNDEQEYGYVIENDFTGTEFPNSFLFGTASCYDQVNHPCHAYDNFSLREQNMALFFAQLVDITTICEPGYSTGVHEQPLEERVDVYPNPVRDRLSIRNTGAEAIHYQVTDLRGQLLTKGSLAGHSSLQIPLGGLPAGLYFVRVYDPRGKEVLSRKIVAIP